MVSQLIPYRRGLSFCAVAALLMLALALPSAGHAVVNIEGHTPQRFRITTRALLRRRPQISSRRRTLSARMSAGTNSACGVGGQQDR